MGTFYKMKTYSQKLKDPRWQKIRLQVFERDAWICQGCMSDSNTLHVHHKNYNPGREPWEYELDNFITLCDECHLSEAEQRKESENTLIAALRWTNFLSGDLHAMACDFHAMRQTHVSEVLCSVICNFLVCENFQKEVTDLYFKKISSRKEALK